MMLLCKLSPKWDLRLIPTGSLANWKYYQEASRIPTSMVFSMKFTNHLTQIAIQHLFLRSWFRRLWIWQEVLLAKFATVVCGATCVPWSTFAAAIRCIINQVKRAFRLSTELPSFRNKLNIAECLTYQELHENLASRDPRLDVSNLKAKGVNIQTFTLV